MRRNSLTSLLLAVRGSATLFAGIASAADVNGTDHQDRIRSTADADAIDAKAGPDDVIARAANDNVLLGPGRDIAWLGDGDDTAKGGKGADWIIGGAGNDRVLADFADVVHTSCETAVRKKPRSRDDQGENNTQSPSEDRKEH